MRSSVLASLSGSLLGLVSSHWTTLAVRIHLFFPIEIDQIEELELAESKQHPGHALIFGSGRSLLCRVGAE